MNTIIRYIKEYIYETDKRVLAAATLFISILIFINYSTGMDDRISSYPFPGHLFSSYATFLVAFIVPYFFYRVRGHDHPWKNIPFVLLIFLAPFIFALKHAFVFPFSFPGNREWELYWEHVLYWPVLVLMTSGLLMVVWKIQRHPENFYGLQAKGIDLKPYLLMLFLMIPLVAAASTQPDFLETYPKLKMVAGAFGEDGLTAFHKFLFELSYGSDFITIELFFRGFLVLAFAKWAGRDAILPMACFYCTIHFGKPIGECISSYFGGILLGIVVYNTRSIVGGLIVHLGIAWLMEAGGYIGGLFQK